MTILSSSATLIDNDGHVAARDLTVAEYPATPDRCATIAIGSSEHSRDDLVVTNSSITSRVAGWEVSL